MIHAQLADGVAWTELPAHDDGIVSGRQGRAVGARTGAGHVGQVVRDACLVQELLLRVGAERHFAVVKALLLDVRVEGLVVVLVLRTKRCSIQPLGRISNLFLLHLPRSKLSKLVSISS